MSNFLPDDKIMCPASAFKYSCREIVSDCTCPKFVQIRGKNPQTGEDVDQWGCVDTFLPMLLLENAQQSRQTGAAVESFRNEVVKASDAQAEAQRRALVELSARAGGPKLIQG